MKNNLYIFFILLLFSANLLADEFSNCPLFDTQSTFAQNMNGKSAYNDSDLSKFFVSLFEKLPYKVNLTNPILDIGTGYGVVSFELIRLGAKNIYANDLDIRNLKCMRKYIDFNYPNKNFKLTYIAGSIFDNNFLSQLSNRVFSLVVAKNVLHFFTYHQLINFIKLLNQITTTNSVVVIFFENPYIDLQREMVYKIFKARKKYPTAFLDQIVEVAYNRTIFPYVRKCSFDVYNKAPKGMKIPGFPCELPLFSGNGQLLFPEIMVALMSAGGFNLVAEKPLSDKTSAQILAFIKKEKNLNDKTIDSNIKKRFKVMLKVMENQS